MVNPRPTGIITSVDNVITGNRYLANLFNVVYAILTPEFELEGAIDTG